MHIYHLLILQSTSIDGRFSDSNIPEIPNLTRPTYICIFTPLMHDSCSVLFFSLSWLATLSWFGQKNMLSDVKGISWVVHVQLMCISNIFCWIGRNGFESSWVGVNRKSADEAVTCAQNFIVESDSSIVVGWLDSSSTKPWKNADEFFTISNLFPN